MKTDTLFYQLFQSFHTLLFELIDHPTSEAEGYKFSSAEIKEKAFRFDGIFMPTANDKPIFLAEVQFQPKEDFYSEFLAEIFLYLNQYRPTQDWQAIAIFAKHNSEPAPDKFCQELITLGRIRRVYLEDLPQGTNSHGIEIIQLILASEKKAPKLARNLAEKIEQETNTELKDNVVEFIEAVLVVRFVSEKLVRRDRGSEPLHRFGLNTHKESKGNFRLV